MMHLSVSRIPYLPERAVRKVKGPAAHALAPYQKLSELRPGWGKAENWIVAQEMNREELIATDLGKFLVNLPSKKGN